MVFYSVLWIATLLVMMLATEDIFLEDFNDGTLEQMASHNQQGPFVLQAHYHYLNEMTLDEKFKVRLLVVDHDKKRMHLCLDIYSINMNKVIAVSEKILVNVNLVARKTEPYPLWAYNRLQTLKKTHEKTLKLHLNHYLKK